MCGMKIPKGLMINLSFFSKHDMLLFLYFPFRSFSYSLRPFPRFSRSSSFFHGIGVWTVCLTWTHNYMESMSLVQRWVHTLRTFKIWFCTCMYTPTYSGIILMFNIFVGILQGSVLPPLLFRHWCPLATMW